MTYKRAELNKERGFRWTCEQCFGGFNRDKSGSRPIRFCSQKCYHAWKKEHNVSGGQFKKGQKPWNKGVKGLRLSQKTEFRKGRKSENWKPVGAETVRTDKNGTKRCWVKVAEPSEWIERSRLVYEKHFGPIPSGYVVHHKDHNAMNDAPGNLETLTRATHIERHRKELNSARGNAA